MVLLQKQLAFLASRLELLPNFILCRDNLISVEPVFQHCLSLLALDDILEYGDFDTLHVQLVTKLFR